MDFKQINMKMTEFRCVLFVFLTCFVLICHGHAGHHHINSVMHVERLIYLERELIEFCDFILHEEEVKHDNRAREVHNFTQIYT